MRQNNDGQKHDSQILNVVCSASFRPQFFCRIFPSPVTPETRYVGSSQTANTSTLADTSDDGDDCVRGAGNAANDGVSAGIALQPGRSKDRHCSLRD